MGRPKKLTDEEILAEMIKRNPSLLDNLIKKPNKEEEDEPELIVKTPSVKASKTKIKSIIPPNITGKTQTFFFDPSIDPAAAAFDKKKPIPVSQRVRKEAEKVRVMCAECKKEEWISEQLYDPTNSHLCAGCLGKKG